MFHSNSRTNIQPSGVSLNSGFWEPWPQESKCRLVVGAASPRKDGFRLGDHPGVDRFSLPCGVRTKPLALAVKESRGVAGEERTG